LSKCRQLAEADAAFRRVIELAPQQAEGYAGLAQVQMSPGRDQQEAVALARTAVQLAPTAAHHHIFATASWNAGDPASSLVALEQALRLDPANGRYREDYIRVQQSLQPLQP
jgi:adsorption protein A